MNRETLQRCFWQPLYDRLARSYDAVDWFTGNTTHRYRRRALPYLPEAGSRVLEIGFGSGKLHLELAEKYWTAGIDLAPGMVRLTRARLDKAGLRSAVQVGDARALPWPDAHFDAVVSTFALSSIPDIEAALDEMTRVLKPGGKLVIVDAGRSGTRFAAALASLWELCGDYIRDEVPLLEARGFTVAREAFGPGGCVHVVAGTKGR